MRKLVTKFRMGGIALSVLIASSGAIGPATAAQAQKVTRGTFHMYCNASPEPVKKGGTVDFHGEIWDEEVDDHSIFGVSLYFKPKGAKRYAYKGMLDSVNYNGRWNRYFRQKQSGTWKVIAWAGDWSGPACYDYVRVK